jgi:hypothetical protein
MRLSNFLLWQLAYAEIYVTPTLWPEFRGVHLLEGISEYQKRERRYGGLAGDAAYGNGSHPHQSNREQSGHHQSSHHQSSHHQSKTGRS